MNIKNQDLLRHQCYVDGVWRDSVSGNRIEVFDPASGRSIGSAPSLTREEVAQAILAAHRAWPRWRALSAEERGRLLRRWHDLLVANSQDLARIMTREQGKPLAEARDEVLYGAAYAEWFAEEAKRVYGETIPAPGPSSRIIVLREPVGVCAAITPWNFPCSMILRKAAPALAAGCPLVIKPSSKTPFSALALAWLAGEAGFPPGVVNVVTGEAAVIGAEMSANPLVRKLSFTGSTAKGKLLMRASASTVKQVSLELGGHAPFIVFDDADLEEAVRGAMTSKYRNSGQTCVCANRFLVQEGVLAAFAERMVAEVRRLRVGCGLHQGVEQGPLIDQEAVRRMEALVADAVDQGARVACGGRRLAASGCFFEPTVLLDVTAAMRVFREETFGPIAPLCSFATEAEAVALANDTPYGLAAYVYSRDAARICRVGEQLEYGIVGVNTGRTSAVAAPFGGVKESGLGREGSKYGLDAYLNLKYLCLGGLEPGAQG